MDLFVMFPSMSLKQLKPQSNTMNPITLIPFGVAAYGFVGQPFSKQLYNKALNVWSLWKLVSFVYPRVLMDVELFGLKIVFSTQHVFTSRRHLFITNMHLTRN